MMRRCKKKSSRWLKRLDPQKQEDSDSNDENDRSNEYEFEEEQIYGSKNLKDYYNSKHQ
jgi:hypothetical protein